jgi:CBS domain-containing protein|tara:strand:+ start:318 stop:689 length:372 start_codon:yes stop_codon:yes gene_type:complete
MKKVDIKNSSFVINDNASIQQAMEEITDNQRGTVIVIDDKFYLGGVVSDGEIRRAMVEGITTVAPVSKIMNTNPTVLSVKEYKSGKADEIFNDKNDIEILPVVDENNKLIDIAVRNLGKRKEI